jgi:HlyD family secretion protein
MSGPSDATVFLEHDPPHWAARSLACLLFLLVGSAAVGSVVIQLPETVASPFVLAPQDGTDPVRAPRDGLIQAVHATDTQSVYKGEVLFLLRSEVTGNRAGELAALQVQLDGARESLENAKKKRAKERRAEEEEVQRLQTRIAHLTRKRQGTAAAQALQRQTVEIDLRLGRERLEHLTQEVRFKQRVRALARDSLARGAKLRQSNALSELDYLNLQLDVDRATLEQEQSQRELKSAGLREGQLQAQLDTQKAEFQLVLDQLQTERHEAEAALAKLRLQIEAAKNDYAELERSQKEAMQRNGIRVVALQRELDTSTGDLVQLMAPCAGTVVRLRVKAGGTFVRAGDILCELAAADDPLQAELAVPPSGVGRLQPEQRVRPITMPFRTSATASSTVRCAG